jgi:hypothetical protein
MSLTKITSEIQFPAALEAPKTFSIDLPYGGFAYQADLNAPTTLKNYADSPPAYRVSILVPKAVYETRFSLYDKYLKAMVADCMKKKPSVKYVKTPVTELEEGNFAYDTSKHNRSIIETLTGGEAKVGDRVIKIISRFAPAVNASYRENGELKLLRLQREQVLNDKGKTDGGVFVDQVYKEFVKAGNNICASVTLFTTPNKELIGQYGSLTFAPSGKNWPQQLTGGYQGFSEEDAKARAAEAESFGIVIGERGSEAVAKLGISFEDDIPY